jgi:hypothetical protein
VILTTKKEGNARIRGKINCNPTNILVEAEVVIHQPVPSIKRGW